MNRTQAPGYTPVPSNSNLATPSSESAPASPRSSTLNGVQAGAIGGGFGPYSYPLPVTRDSVHSNSRFSHAASLAPLSPLLRVNTASISPQYWEGDPDLDDALHNPKRPDPSRSFTLLSLRGWVNATALLLLVFGLLALFIGYPVVSAVQGKLQTKGTFNIAINGTGQVPVLPGMRTLIDADTPESAYSRTGITDGKKYNLVFSDEFNRDGRTFFPGDDPYWEAVDLHYWPTGDLEWYDPSTITTANGNLVITMTEVWNHDLNFMSGMLQSWNKLCFTTGYLEVRLSLPGSVNSPGFWPGAWTMGNLGRAGYGATTEGNWPYSYDSCDVGTLANQTRPDGTPTIVKTGGSGNVLSELPGQRLSACTCPGEDHPGPDVTVGRSSPEIDMIEAQIDTSIPRGQVSQSFQVAPFNLNWEFDNATMKIVDTNLTKLNGYRGSQTQQAVSALTYIPDDLYSAQNFGVFGLEWWSNPSNRGEGFITWSSNGVESWSIDSAVVGADNNVQISQRLIPEEPMYLILNLGMSPGFQHSNFDAMPFPSQYLVDYVRFYQREGVVDGVTCDPPHHPTQDYINRHANAYTNPNYTIWADAGYTFPKNSILGC